MAINIDTKVVEGFGKEWTQFNQSGTAEGELEEIFQEYFDVFPWDQLPEQPIGFDLGCGSGRWADFVAPRVGYLHCIDPAQEALSVAKEKLSSKQNCEFHLASVDEIPLDDDSMDFGYSLGVLHHVPDTQNGIASCVKKLKKGAPFLVYLYYAFDNKPFWFKGIWKLTELFRFLISRSPYPLRLLASQVIAFSIYFPLARLSKMLERIGKNVDSIPLSYYRNNSFYTMRTDALDRFGTRLEQRFTRKQITEMMDISGMENIEFSTTKPYWCVVGFKK